MPMRIIAVVLFLLAGAAQANTGSSGSIPERMIADLQRDIGLAEHQAAGIVGNLAQETGNFTMLQERGGPGIGYSQWNGSRKREFLTYAAKRGGKASYEANYGFVLLELRRDYPELIHNLRRTDTVEEATGLFMRVFLRPSRKYAALSKRIDYAEDYLAQQEVHGAGTGTRPGFRPVARPAKGSPGPLRLAMAD